MISYTIYKLIHVAGVMMVFLSVGGAVMRAAIGSDDRRWRRMAAVTHGVGLFLVLLGGFGMMARLGISFGWPGWIVGKVIIWLALGGMLAAVGRRAAWAQPVWFAVLLLGSAAAYLAIAKPF